MLTYLARPRAYQQSTRNKRHSSMMNLLLHQKISKLERQVAELEKALVETTESLIETRRYLIDHIRMENQQR